MIKTNETQQAFQKNFLAFAGELAEMFAFNRSIGHLYGFLYISPQPVSLEEIAKGCKMSKGNASIHLRTLEHWGAVIRSWQPGERKDYYAANTDIKGIVMRRLTEGLHKRITHIHSRLETMHAELANGAEAENSHVAKRIQEMQDLLEKGEQWMSWVTKLSSFGKKGL